MAEGETTTSIRALAPADAEALRELRLEALTAAPASFGSSREEEAALSLETFRARLSPATPSVIFGAFAGDRLVGMAGFLASEKAKHRHKGILWGVYLRPEWRGRGLAERLVRQVIEHAARHVLLLQAHVEASNDAARRIYYRLGFVRFGIERQALCVDGIFYDEELLQLQLEPTRAEPPPSSAARGW